MRKARLYYYRARYYDPQTGRFISEDPIGFAGASANLYEYVNGNPINFTDPSGLDPIQFLKDLFFDPKGIGQNSSFSRRSATLSPEEILEITPEELEKQQALEKQCDAAAEAGFGTAGTAAGGLNPAEAITGLVVGETATAAADPEDNGFFARVGRFIGSFFD